MSGSEPAELIPSDPALAPELTAHPPEPELLATQQAVAAERGSIPGGSRELLKLALPLVLSQSFMTVQVFLDTVLLSWHDPNEMAASFPPGMWYWLGFWPFQGPPPDTPPLVAPLTR